MSWLKENWFKLGLLVIVLITGVCIIWISHYALVKVPQKQQSIEQEQWIAEQTSRCKKIANNYTEKQEEKQSDAVWMAEVLEADYVREKETCLAAIKLYLRLTTEYEYHFINPESGKEFAIYWYDYSSETTRGNWNTYKNIYEKTFGYQPVPDQ